MVGKRSGNRSGNGVCNADEGLLVADNDFDRSRKAERSGWEIGQDLQSGSLADI